MSANRRQPYRPAPARAVFMIAAALAALPWGAARAVPASAPVSPETVEVTTSRGVFDLVVYPAHQGAAPAG